MLTNVIKPLLAKDVVPERLKFPCYVMPKIDGCFMLVHEGKAYGRSLKQFENKSVVHYYSSPKFSGLRGEIIHGDDPIAEGLCRDTSSAIRSIEGNPETSWFIFDYVTEESKDLPYCQRWNLADNLVKQLQEEGFANILMIGYNECKSFKQYEILVQSHLRLGFEGVVVRDPSLGHKEGRSSSTKAHCWRFKPYLDAEIICTGITEGETNLNAAETNELGRTKRSSKQENKAPNAMLGSIQGNLIADLKDNQGKVIKASGDKVTISPGEMTVEERKYFFANPVEILGRIAKFKYMSYGLKDTGRFMTFICFRNETDIS